MAVFNCYLFIRDIFLTESITLGTGITLEPLGILTPNQERDQMRNYIFETLQQDAPQIDNAALGRPDRFSQYAVLNILTVPSASLRSVEIEALQVARRLQTVLAARLSHAGEVFGTYMVDCGDPSQNQISLLPHGYPLELKLDFTGSESRVIREWLALALVDPHLLYLLSLYQGVKAEPTEDFYVARLWNLLEAMAHAEDEPKKEQRVRAYLTRVNVRIPKILGHDLLSLAYQWRNCVVHEGGLVTPNSSRKCKQLVSDHSERLRELPKLLDDLVSKSLEAYCAKLKKQGILRLRGQSA